MLKITTILVSAVFASGINARTLDFPQAGFSIDSIDAAPSLAGAHPLQMFLPPQNGFSPNVNVQIQPYPGTMKQYLALSESQFKQLGVNVISTKDLGDTVFFECAGSMQGMELHFYAKAIKEDDFVYLVTATDSIQNWNTNKTKLIQAVDSFKLK